MNFYPGQKIVCVDEFMGSLCGEPLPEKNKIYICDEIFTENNRTGVYLRGFNFVNPFTGIRIGYTIHAFRPLDLDGSATKEVLEKFAPVEEKPDVEITEPCTSQ